MSTVISNYLRDFVIAKEVTFKAPMPNAKTIKAIEEARRDYKTGKNISPVFSNAKEAIAYLKNNR
jgi:antitoxin component of RelBE/YafQ-DinJ toxin-antitoxin module